MRPVGGGGGGFVKPGSSNNGISGGSSGFGKPNKGKPSKGKWVKKVVIGAAAAYTGYKVWFGSLVKSLLKSFCVYVYK